MKNDLWAPAIPPREDARFLPLVARTEVNWRENNPEMVADLERQGKLKACVESAAEQAIVILQQSEMRGLGPDQGEELAYESLFFPSADEKG